jgi:2-methylcitrate dehydratase
MARYVAETEYGALDQTTIEAAKAHLIDAIGCGISAYHEDAVRACRDVALAVPGGVSTVIGTKRRTTPDLATFANGAAIRYFDFNDLYFGREPGHPSDNITACLAIAEAEGRNGRDFLLAMVLAYEIDCRLLDAAELTRKGWDHPINSLPASALAAGKLMGLPAKKLEQAVNIARDGRDLPKIANLFGYLRRCQDSRLYCALRRVRLHATCVDTLYTTDFTYRSAARDKEKWAPETKDGKRHEWYGDDHWQL